LLSTTTCGTTECSYLFIEEGTDFGGKRLSLTVIARKPIQKRSGRSPQLRPPISEEESKYLVHFHIEVCDR